MSGLGTPESITGALAMGAVSASAASTTTACTSFLHAATSKRISRRRRIVLQCPKPIGITPRLLETRSSPYLRLRLDDDLDAAIVGASFGGRVVSNRAIETEAFGADAVARDAS